MDSESGTGITGGGSGYAAHLAHEEGVLYGTELGSVTLKRVGLFCSPTKRSTHTYPGLGKRVYADTPRPGVDSNVSAWSRPSVVAVHKAVSPGVCAPARRFQD